ncbi:unnamed protein product [Oppiella nova]|uniref:Uncharacterized protein n=1 Tax=Oppiella nova TaxID=334625 RepID=A0A7R9QWR1_9ACAR|nr:unnamed protein product [Oppiella nova]CAG2176813.1 unnamed protein product [Oppiella nova]
MDFQSMMETFAEAWVAANVQTPLTEAAEQGLLLSSSLGGMGAQNLELPFESPGRRQGLGRESGGVLGQSSSQSSSLHNTDDESASPLNTCPPFSATDLKGGLLSNQTLALSPEMYIPLSPERTPEALQQFYNLCLSFVFITRFPT